MRSIFIHLIGTTSEEIGTRLSTFADKVDDTDWIFPQGTSAPILYISFYKDLESESEPSDLVDLHRSLGQKPDVSIVANVSGRVSGAIEVRQLIERLLGEFRGVAWDDYTNHCWTLAEIQLGKQANGHPFFDYQGWHQAPPTV